ncbi:unnamed protein product [Citrullus colocynthis]|uniref:E3 ubiquitin-protein ligase RMA n=1 Tax=Citrullus colocynthis TaxID=252529 RepID=A0ABP0XWT8_9ROSI
MEGCSDSQYRNRGTVGIGNLGISQSKQFVVVFNKIGELLEILTLIWVKNTIFKRARGCEKLPFSDVYFSVFRQTRSSPVSDLLFDRHRNAGSAGLFFLITRWGVLIWRAGLGNRQVGNLKALLVPTTMVMLECPVCKAIIEEQKLVPLYGRGKTSTDPRSKSIPGINIPNRPAGQRPEAAGPPPEPNPFPHNGFGFMGGLGGFAPMASTRFGNFTLSAAFGGLVPSLFNFQMHGYADPSMYGAGANFPYGFPNMFHGSHGHGHGYYHQLRQGQQDYYLKRLLLLLLGEEVRGQMGLLLHMLRL